MLEKSVQRQTVIVKNNQKHKTETSDHKGRNQRNNNTFNGLKKQYKKYNETQKTLKWPQKDDMCSQDKTFDTNGVGEKTQRDTKQTKTEINFNFSQSDHKLT